MPRTSLTCWKWLEALRSVWWWLTANWARERVINLSVLVDVQLNVLLSCGTAKVLFTKFILDHFWGGRSRACQRNLKRRILLWWAVWELWDSSCNCCSINYDLQHSKATFKLFRCLRRFKCIVSILFRWNNDTKKLSTSAERSLINGQPISGRLTTLFALRLNHLFRQ